MTETKGAYKSSRTKASRSIAAADFKARCLQLMDRVRETGAEYVVTKHGQPVAKLVPYKAPRRTQLFGSMRGTVLKYERPFDPIDADWDVNRGQPAEPEGVALQTTRHPRRGQR
jgi:prevent-host-death family protein